MRRLAMIVAASSNDVIGAEGGMPWHLPADLRRFKKLTMGHHIIMGRKTYESIGRLLPGRTSVIVTRQPSFNVVGARIANSVEEAIQIAKDDDCPFITGGAQIYERALPQITDLYLTRIQIEISGDTYLPEIDWDEWELVKSQQHLTSTGSELNCSFEDYRRISMILQGEPPTEP